MAYGLRRYVVECDGYEPWRVYESSHKLAADEWAANEDAHHADAEVVTVWLELDDGKREPGPGLRFRFRRRWLAEPVPPAPAG